MPSIREELFSYIQKKYKGKPERLWARFPDYVIFRHADNEKWYALIMDVPANRLGLPGDEPLDILNVKMSSPLLADLLIDQPGYFRGYHISRGNWVSIALDGSVPMEEITRWLEESYLTTASAAEKHRRRPPKPWLVPANPAYYDVVSAFEASKEIAWKQGRGIKKGDTVFLYVGAPVSAVLYQCKVTETDVPWRRHPEHKLMMIRLQKQFPPDRFPFERLKEEFDVRTVRGPRGVPEELLKAFKRGK